MCMAMRTVDAGKEAALVWFSQQTPFLILLSFLIPLLALIYYFMNVLVLPKFASSKIWRPTTVSFPTPVYDGLRLPLLGNALSLGRQGSKFLLHCHEKYGDAFSLNVFGQTMVFLCSPESIVYFFRAPGTCLSFTPAVQQFTHRVFELHPMDFLPRHRSMLLSLRHAISGEALPQHATTLAQLLVRQAHCVLFKPEDGNHGSTGISKTVELYSAIKEIFFPAAVSCLFGAKFLQRHGQRAVLDMFSKFEGAFERAASPLPHVFQIKFRESRAFLVEIFRLSIDCGDFEGTVVGRLLQDSGLPPHAHPNFLLTLLWASQANTLPAAFWSIAFLSLPENLRFVEAIQETVSGDGDNNGEMLHRICLEACNPNSLLARCCHEAVRLRSPSIDVRIAVSNIVVPVASNRHVAIAKGSVVAVNPWIANLDPRFYETPHVYDPDRTSVRLPHPVAGIQGISGLSFGGGVYRCPGRQFATMELAVLVGILITNFDFRLDLAPNEAPKSDRIDNYTDRPCFPGDPGNLLPPPDLQRLVGIKLPAVPCSVECSTVHMFKAKRET